jgi:hypothetical protein
LKQAPHEEGRHLVRRVARRFEAARQPGQVGRHLAGHLGGFERRVERDGIGEDRPQGVEMVGQVAQEDAGAPAVGEGPVVARAVERGVEVEAVADVADHQERRRLVERAGVAQRLAVGIAHGDVPGRGAAARAP